MKDKKIFKILSIFCVSIYWLGIIWISRLILLMSLKKEDAIILFINLFLIIYFSYFFHELGHLIFGLLSKMKFKSFSVSIINIYTDKGKLKISIKKHENKVLGKCAMTLTKISRKNNGLFYMFGGIIFNFILALIALVLLYNIKIDIGIVLCYWTFILNLYLALYNLIPKRINSLIVSDGKKIEYILKDYKYLNKGEILDKYTLKKFSNELTENDIDKIKKLKNEFIKTELDIYILMLLIDYYNDNNKIDMALELLNDIDYSILNDDTIYNLFCCRCESYLKIKEIIKLKKEFKINYKEYYEKKSKDNYIYSIMMYLYYSLIKNNNKQRIMYYDNLNGYINIYNKKIKNSNDDNVKKVLVNNVENLKRWIEIIDKNREKK